MECFYVGAVRDEVYSVVRGGGHGDVAVYIAAEAAYLSNMSGSKVAQRAISTGYEICVLGREGGEARLTRVVAKAIFPRISRDVQGSCFGRDGAQVDCHAVLLLAVPPDQTDK